NLLIVVLALILTFTYFKKFRLLAIIGCALFLVRFGRLSSRLIRQSMATYSALQEVTVPAYCPKVLRRKPDVYFLIYDAYMGQKFTEFMGIENSNQFEYLKSQGFEIYENALSQDGFSLGSISKVYAMGPTDVSKRKTLVGHNRLDKF